MDDYSSLNLHFYLFFCIFCNKQDAITLLGLLGYTQLFIDHLILGKIDTHGGYFDGNFTKELIHKLAFFGFDGLLKSYSSEAQTESTDTLSELSKKCQEKQIQVVLSPQRMPKH